MQLPNYLNISIIANSGQCFLWKFENDFWKTRVGKSDFIKINSKNLEIESSLNETQLKHYFNLENNYDEILNILKTDTWTKECVEKYHGLQLLNQDPVEIIFSFILSQNNSVNNVTNCLNRVLDNLYLELENKNTNYETFLSFLNDSKCGYRGAYLVDALKCLKKGKFKEMILNYRNFETEVLRAELMKIHGIGRKVADCILLYSMEKYEVVPMDTWIEKASEKLLTSFHDKGSGLRFAGRKVKNDQVQFAYENLFGKYAGYAQLFHFYALRNEKNSSKNVKVLTR